MQMDTFAQRFLDYNAGPDASTPLVTPEQAVKNFHAVRPLLSFSHRVMLRKFLDNGCDYAELACTEIEIELQQVQLESR